MITKISIEIKQFIIQCFSSRSDFDDLCRELDIQSGIFAGDFDVRVTSLIMYIERRKRNPAGLLMAALLKLRPQFRSKIDSLFETETSVHRSGSSEQADYKIFISYSRKNIQEVNYIDTLFKSKGVLLVRDERQLEYKGDVNEFMQTIRQSDYVITLLSDSYLKSPYCMFEALELLKENFKVKILPVYLDDIQLYKPENRIFYIQYWNDRYDTLNRSASGLDRIQSASITEELKHTNNIRLQIDEFMGRLAEMRLLSFQELKNSDFKEIFSIIGLLS